MVLFSDFTWIIIVCQPKRQSWGKEKEWDIRGNVSEQVTSLSSVLRGQCPPRSIPALCNKSFHSLLRQPQRRITIYFWPYSSNIFLLSTFGADGMIQACFQPEGKEQNWVPWKKALSPRTQKKGWSRPNSWCLPWSKSRKRAVPLWLQVAFLWAWEHSTEGNSKCFSSYIKQ